VGERKGEWKRERERRERGRERGVGRERRKEMGCEGDWGRLCGRECADIFSIERRGGGRWWRTTRRCRRGRRAPRFASQYRLGTRKQVCAPCAAEMLCPPFIGERTLRVLPARILLRNCAGVAGGSCHHSFVLGPVWSVDDPRPTPAVFLHPAPPRSRADLEQLVKSIGKAATSYFTVSGG
jgi:hypothetical protein